MGMGIEKNWKIYETKKKKKEINCWLTKRLIWAIYEGQSFGQIVSIRGIIVVGIETIYIVVGA